MLSYIPYSSEREGYFAFVSWRGLPTSAYNGASIRGRKLVGKMTTFGWNSWREEDRRDVLTGVPHEETQDGGMKKTVNTKEETNNSTVASSPQNGGGKPVKKVMLKPNVI